jgi:hypothetical protein
MLYFQSFIICLKKLKYNVLTAWHSGLIRNIGTFFAVSISGLV